MKPLILTLFIILGSSFIAQAQTADTIDSFDKLSEYFRYDTYEYAFTKNKSWAKNTKTITFENQGEHNSTYLAINNDSTFIFLSIYEPGEFLTTGSWTKLNDTTYNFNWSKSKSLMICSDSNIYKKYYKYSFPLPLKITNWIFIKRDLQLLPTVKRPLR
jgi:hypothetical protein